MPEDRVLPTSQPTDHPSYEIKVDGEAVNSRVFVMSVVVFKGVNRIPWCKITLVDGDAASENFHQSNSDEFIPGKEIEITAGYHQDNQTIFKGIIVKHGIKIKQGQTKKLIVECRDASFKMTLGRRSAFYYDMTDSDIMDEIIGQYGLDKSVESTSVSHLTMVKNNCTDWDFIVTRAEANGLVVLADDGTVNIQPPDAGQGPALDVLYGATIFEFEGEFDSRIQMTALAAQAWNSADQEVIVNDGSEPTEPAQGNISSGDLSSASGFEEHVLRHGGQRPTDEVQSWADAQLIKTRLARVKGRVQFRGIPEVKPGMTIDLGGLGDRFNGTGYISAIRHELSAGKYMMDVQLGLEDEWFAEKHQINAPKAGALMPAVSGLQIGVVTQLADDPDGEDRIRITLPHVDATEVGVWARVCTLDAGANRGSFWRPEIGDEVIIGFIDDDPRDAVVLGMLNSSAKPAPAQASDDNHEKGFVSRGEMRIWFNDDDNSLTLDTPNGNKIVLSEADGSIVIEDENSNIFEMNSDGITIESPSDINIKATGDLNLEGTNVNLTANAQLTASGSAGAEVSSSGTTDIKGSLVNLN